MIRKAGIAAVVACFSVGITLPAAAAPDVAYLTPGSNDYVYRLRIRDTDGETSTLKGQGAIGKPGFSSDGTMIAFTVSAGDGDLGRYQLFSSNIDGSGMTQLTSPSGGDFDPAWSPDDSQIAFSRDSVGSMVSSSCCDIWVMSSDGSGETRIPNTGGGINPTWSPNGKRIAFEAPGGIYTIKPNGSGKDRVGPRGREPAWAPSGDRIAYIRRSSSNPPADKLVVVDLSDESKAVWWDAPRHLESPQWVGSSISVVSYNGYGYADRKSAKLRLVKEWGDRDLIFAGDKEMIFAVRPSSRCLGRAHSYSSGSSQVLGKDNASDCFGRALATGDFDNDGWDDIAIGNPGERGAGAVHVIYGSSSGVGLSGQLRLTQDSPSVGGSSEYGDQFGRSLAAGDFDGDGYDDLAVGVPGEDIGKTLDAGSIAIFYGSPIGIRVTNNHRISQSTGGIPGASEPGDSMGASLISGDFDGDGFSDLAIGMPGEEISGKAAAGAVVIVDGTASGLAANTGELIHAGTVEVPGAVQSHDSLGAALASGDFDDDGRDDLAIGVPGKDEGSKRDVGSVIVIEGRAAGLNPSTSMSISQNTPGFKGTGEKNDRYGAVVAAGRIDGDSFDDLVIGAPGEGLGGKPESGEIEVVFGSSGGLGDRDRRYHQDIPGVKGKSQRGDRFGASLAIGDFDGDGFGDIAIGVPGENGSGVHDSGRVAILYGKANGVSKKGDQRLGQNTSGVSGGDQRGDQFGAAIATGRLNAGARSELIVGIPGETRGSVPKAGSIVALYGAPSGLTGQGSDRLSQSD